MSISAVDIDLAQLLAATEDDSCGALVVFSGTIRNHHDDRAVTALSYTAHEVLAIKAIQQVEAEAKEKFGVPQCKIVHRIGDLKIGDVAIHCVVRSAHRQAAFEAAKYAIDEVKKRAPIWKQETYVDGEKAYRDGEELKPN